MNSTQLKLNRVRPSRVRIFFEVETDGSEKKVELPFVIGVISDLSGDNISQSTIDNSFVEVDIDTFNSFLNSCKPYLSYTVENVIKGEGSIKVDLVFQSQEDFEIKNIINQVDITREVYEDVRSLRYVSILIDGNEEVSDYLNQLLIDKNKIDEMISMLEEEINKNKLVQEDQDGEEE